MEDKINMKKYTLSALFILLSFACFAQHAYKDKHIQYQSVTPDEATKKALRQLLNSREKSYDKEAHLLVAIINSWGYHRDAVNARYHHTRESFYYAADLLDMNEEETDQRAFDILERLVALQDTLPTSPTCGVWPYYPQEPLATKLSPVDYNWADFCATGILDALMRHGNRLPETLKQQLEHALYLAARSVEKRNADLSYTNIAIMGTYVTYMAAHLLNIEDMKLYATDRMNRFYQFTLQKGGFTEYNSPTYTITALDELQRMRQHIVAADLRPKIDSLYTLAWESIARHYHRPTAQWAGPHSRVYDSLVRTSFYRLLNYASQGEIDLGYEPEYINYKLKHRIPKQLMGYFLAPLYPRTEKDVFDNQAPQITGTTYLAPDYALGTANRSSMWNQRRPFILYWGNEKKPHYLQVRFLHELYDFSAAGLYSSQEKNGAIVAINFSTTGGDKHINLDLMKDGRFKAKDLRLRFEFGNHTNADLLQLPHEGTNATSFVLDKLQFNIDLFFARFGTFQGYWEKGGDKNRIWLDYVIYSGEEQEICLEELNVAAMGFSFSIDNEEKAGKMKKTHHKLKNGWLNAKWNKLEISIPVKPEKLAPNL